MDDDVSSRFDWGHASNSKIMLAVIPLRATIKMPAALVLLAFFMSVVVPSTQPVKMGWLSLNFSNVSLP